MADVLRPLAPPVVYTGTECKQQAKVSLGARRNSEMYVILNDLAQQVALVVLIHQPLLK